MENKQKTIPKTISEMIKETLGDKISEEKLKKLELIFVNSDLTKSQQKEFIEFIRSVI